MQSVFDILCQLCYDIQDIVKESELNAVKRLLIGALLLCLLFLAGCSMEHLEVENAKHPLEALQEEYANQPKQETIPEGALVSPYTGEPDPLPGEKTESTLVVNGRTVKTPIYLQDGIYYVSAERVMDTLKANAEIQPDQCRFRWNGTEIRLVRGAANYFYGEAIRSLGEQVPVCCEDGMLVPMKALCDSLRISLFYDSEEDRFYITPGAGKFDIPAGVRIPVLMYHAVGDDIWGDEELFVSTADMEAQLAWLVEHGYTPIFLEDLARADQIEKPVLLTFDDGYKNNYEELFPLLQKYNCKVTIFVVTDLVDQADHKMTSEQIKELSDSGLVSIQSHTGSHPHLKQLSAENQREEMRRSKLALLRITGKEPYALCYPYGEYNKDTLNQMAGLYTVATKIGNLDYVTGQDRRTIARWYMKRSTTMEEFIAMIEP